MMYQRAKHKKQRKFRGGIAVLLAGMMTMTQVLSHGAFVHANAMMNEQVSLRRDTKTITQVRAGEVIEIATAEQLKLIGQDSAYPMNGDYVLTADIDLSKESWTPIGGYIGQKGATTGSNVFSGTFDGQGHVIRGLNMDMTGRITDDGSYAQVGLFSVIASEDGADYAVVRDVIFADVDMTIDFSNGYAAVGTLAGEVNGYATVEEIAIVSGTLNVNASARCDTVGVGGLIGECRTNDSSIGNGNITVKNIYNGANIVASGSRSDLLYAAGVIGRVAKSSCKEISACVNTGVIQYDGFDGFAIIASEARMEEYVANLTDCYYLKNTAQILASEATECKEKVLKSGELQSGLSEDIWVANKDCYPVLKSCMDSTVAGQIVLAGLSLEFATDEEASQVKTEIVLPQEISGEALTWTSDNEAVLKIENGKAIAITDEIGADTVVTLTATLPDGHSKEYKLTVIAANPISATFDCNYAQVGKALTVTVSNMEDKQLTYEWKVDGKTISNTTSSYTPTADDLESFITVKITSVENGMYWNLSTYCSELPVIYIDTDDGQEVTSNSTSKDATMKVQGNAEFNDESTYYEGVTEIKGRGNSTWHQAVAWDVKKPYKLKLDKKANLLGIGEGGKNGKNKHWVLLANMIDHTNIRNEIVSLFSKALGMEYTMSTTNVVLILNGEYQGIYQLCEHLRVASERVDIYDWENTAEEIAQAVEAVDANVDSGDLEDYLVENMSWMTTGKFNWEGKEYTVTDYFTEEIPDITGGFMLDMDFRSVDDSFKYISTFLSSNGIPMFFRAPEYAKTCTVLLNFAKNYINAYEAAIGSADYTTSYNNQTVHYTDLFDMDSLVQYWLICEYTNNWDSMKNSTYLYKDIEGKAKMGPAWDYDWAFGNINMYSNTMPFVVEGWHTTLCKTPLEEGGFWEQSYQNKQWNCYLVTDPYFVTKAYEYYKTHRTGIIENIMKDGGIIDTLEDKYESASLKNDEVWSGTYGLYSGMAYVNGVAQMTQSQTYHDATDSLKTYITNRVNWFDRQFTSVDNLYRSLGNTVSSQISVKASGTKNQVVITADVTNSNAKYVEIIVNGKTQTVSGSKYIPVTNKKATITINGSNLQTGQSLNTVQVIGLNSAKTMITGLKNFSNFKVNGANQITDSSGKTDGTTVTTGSTSNGTQSNNQSQTTGTNVVKAAKVLLSATSKTLKAGQTLQLKATVLPAKASQKVLFTSDKPSVASVSTTGKVKAKKAGTAIITVKTKDGSKKATCKIKVKKMKVTGKAKLKVKKSMTMKVKNATGTIKWKLDKKGKKLLKLSKTKGKKVKVTAKKKTGTAKITITCSGQKITKKIKVVK